jgi:hypothetical protein
MAARQLDAVVIEEYATENVPFSARKRDCKVVGLVKDGLSIKITHQRRSESMYEIYRLGVRARNAVRGLATRVWGPILQVAADASVLMLDLSHCLPTRMPEGSNTEPD